MAAVFELARSHFSRSHHFRLFTFLVPSDVGSSKLHCENQRRNRVPPFISLHVSFPPLVFVPGSGAPADNANHIARNDLPAGSLVQAETSPSENYFSWID
jgi:hypothetical protein